jgi:hypothetical protein
VRPRIVQYGLDVYLLSQTGKGAQRWVKKTGKFSSVMYYRPYVHSEGRPVPADHPAHAHLERFETTTWGK